MLKQDKPFMCARLGAEESRVVLRWTMRWKYSERNIHNIMYNAGVFPNNKEGINEFCEVYSSALEQLDAAFVWGCVGEKHLLKKYASKEIQYLAGDVNQILFHGTPWTVALEGKKVLIVHPFIETIKKQYINREKLFERPTLSEFSKIEYVKAIQTNAGEHENCGFSCWKDALKHMKEEIETKDFDVALIGAGAYGIPLAAYVKSMGKQAIHMASNLQILFGIRGKRWDGWSQWTPYFNEYWVYPLESETPSRSILVEGGSYWK